MSDIVTGLPASQEAQPANEHGTGDGHATGDAHAADVRGEPEGHPADNAHAAHGDAHGAAVLGPVDWRAWLAGVVGVGAGLAVVVAMLLRPGA
jgi:hypothetical protein